MLLYKTAFILKSCLFRYNFMSPTVNSHNFNRNRIPLVVKLQTNNRNNIDEYKHSMKLNCKEADCMSTDCKHSNSFINPCWDTKNDIHKDNLNHIGSIHELHNHVHTLELIDKNILISTGRQVNQNFHSDCEEKINVQINNEYTAGYMYLGMASFCSQDNVALYGFYKFLYNSYEEEKSHGEKLIEYLNKRGGQLRLTDISAPVVSEWKTVEQIICKALCMEKELNKYVLELHQCASEHRDASLTDFLESYFLQEQVEAIKYLADLLTIIRRAGNGLGVHIVDKQLKESSSKRCPRKNVFFKKIV